MSKSYMGKGRGGERLRQREQRLRQREPHLQRPRGESELSATRQPLDIVCLQHGSRRSKMA